MNQLEINEVFGDVIPRAWGGITGDREMKIELACDHAEAEDYCAWLNSHGHNAIIGNDSHGKINEVDHFMCPGCDDCDEAATLWEKYCNEE